MFVQSWCDVLRLCSQNAHGIIDARESSISHLEYDLSSEQGRVKELQKQMPSLESRLKDMVDELKSNHHSLEEKTGIIQQMRRQLKHTKDKNVVSATKWKWFKPPEGIQFMIIVPAILAVC